MARVKQWDAQTLRAAATGYIDRVRHSVQFPITDRTEYQIYMSLAPKEIQKLVREATTGERTKSYAKKWFTYNFRGTLNIELPSLEEHEERIAHLEFVFDGNRISSEDASTPVDTSHPRFNEVLSFVEQVAAVDRDIARAARFVWIVTQHLNTTGQMYRVWPQIANVMGSSYVEDLKQAKKKSPLPPDFIKQHLTSPEDEIEFEKLRQHATVMLAKGMLFKDDESTKRHPSIWAKIIKRAKTI